MTTKRVPLIYSIIVLSLELVYIFLMFFVEKLGSQIEYVLFAISSFPLLPLAISSLVIGIRYMRDPEAVKKKATAVVVMGAVAIFFFCLIVVSLAFLVGTGHLPHYYFYNGF